MSVRSPLYVLAFVFGLALLILIVSLGAIVAISFRNRGPGFSYFAGGTRSCSHAAATGEQA
jgi:ABC-type nickel/cobalt efflux system permease component RcnA